MSKANKATVDWDKEKKHWRVRVQVGEEVIKRTLSTVPQDANDDLLRKRAVEDAHDEGYDVDPASVAIIR